MTVLSTGDPGVLAIAKSILQSARVEFLVLGEEVQDLFGIGRFPGRLNVFTGAMQLQVSAEDESEARVGCCRGFSSEQARGSTPGSSRAMTTGPVCPGPLAICWLRVAVGYGPGASEGGLQHSGPSA